jgi:flagellar biosynthesis/type III secretory pathway ATPase
MREVLAVYQKQKDLILLGAYQPGADSRVDFAISNIDKIHAFLRQAVDERASAEETVARLKSMF